MILVAIDPGPVESAWVLYDTQTRQPVRWAKTLNEIVIATRVPQWTDSHQPATSCAIEMVASYGMPVGAEVFETCVWIGRFIEQWQFFGLGPKPHLLYRRDVKLHVCGNPRAKDGNIRQAIIDRYGGKEQAIGRKATPGPLYGLTGDCWQALAVAITAAETTSLEAAA